MNIHSGMNLRDAIRIAKTLGIVVEQIPATGEVRFSHQLGKKIQNLRRKDASRDVVVLLRRVSNGGR